MKKWEDPVYLEDARLRHEIARVKQELAKAQEKYKKFKLSQREHPQKMC